METSILIALSRQDVLRRNLDVVANNLANMDTNGFKAERLMFSDHLVRIAAENGPRGAAIAFVRDPQTVRDPAPGRLQETGGDLDVAVADDGYLVVSSPTGERYTRNGHLRLDENGQLVTDHGLPVLSQQGAPFTFGPQDTQIAIASDGTISTPQGELGRLRVVRFAEPALLEGVEAGLMMVNGQPPEVVPTPRVIQGMVERSNVEPILEIDRLIDVQRAYDQARTLVEKEDERIGKMLQVYAQ